MKSDAATVAEYIDEQPSEWQPTLRKLRAACRRALKGHREVMRHGMPAYARDGEVEVAFARQARYLSLYVMNESVVEAHRAALADLELGKGCIRYRSPDQLDWDVVESVLVDSRDAESSC